ncbi:MAG: cytochrome c [Verrucomicrobiota bacterium]
MIRSFTAKVILLGGLLLFPLSTLPSQSKELIPRDELNLQVPRVFREVMPGHPRSIIGKVDESLWVSYDINTGELTHAWTPRSDGAAIVIQGITSDGLHGEGRGSDGVFPEPIGEVFEIPEKMASPYPLPSGVQLVELDSSTFDDQSWTLTWRALLEDDSWFKFSEQISFDPNESSLVRTFTSSNHPDSDPFISRLKDLNLTELKSSFPVFRKEGRNFIPGEVAPLTKPERGGFGERLNNLHPDFKSLDITPLFGEHTLRVGGLDFLSNGDLLVAGWEPRGGVYRITNPGAKNIEDMKMSLFAHGLHAPLGLLVHDDRVFLCEKHQLIELVDSDGDGFAETHRNLCSRWGAGMNFHQFTHGPVFYQGKLHVATSVNVLSGGATSSTVEKDRGCLLAIDLETHDYEVIAAGLRTPNGIGHGPLESLLVLDNQGDYKPANPILAMEKGAFYHHKYNPPHPLSEKDPTWPAVWLTQGVFGNSPTDPLLIEDGPFADQILFGDIRYGGLKRAFLEKIGGRLQGGAVRYTGGIRGGVNRITQAPNGDIFVGMNGSGGNWARDAKDGLQRLRPKPKANTFEIVRAELCKNGFVIHFSQPLRDGIGWSEKDYLIKSYWLEPTSNYGGKPQDVESIDAKSASVSEDRKSVFIELAEITPHRHFEILLPDGFSSQKGFPLWTGDLHYTVVNTAEKVGQPLEKPADFVKVRKGKKQKAFDPMESIYRSICIGCHSLDGTAVAGPTFKGISGAERIVIRDGKEVTVTADLDYIIKSIREPHSELVKGYQPLMPDLTAVVGEENIEPLAKYILKIGKPQK